MIYNSKTATFNYPIYTNGSNAYEESEFNLYIEELNEQQEYYDITYTIDITSSFIKGLIDEKMAEMIIVIQTKDNYFIKIEELTGSVSVPKQQLSLRYKTQIQVLLSATEKISFFECFELTPRYSNLKHDIVVQKNNLLGYSNVNTLNGVDTKATELFEYSIDESLNVPFKIELNETFIILKFKDIKYSFKQLSNLKGLNNMYIYQGLTRAIQQFIMNTSISADDGDDFFVELDLVDEVSLSVLDRKLFDLMKNKGVTELDMTMVDEVVNQISYQIIEKFVDEILGVVDSES